MMYCRYVYIVGMLLEEHNQMTTVDLENFVVKNVKSKILNSFNFVNNLVYEIK